MKAKVAISCLLLGSLPGSGIALADEDATSAGSHAAGYGKDSTITAKVKTKLAAEHLTSSAHIHFDTDANGVVWLSGTARTHAAFARQSPLRVIPMASRPSTTASKSTMMNDE